MDFGDIRGDLQSAISGVQSGDKEYYLNTIMAYEKEARVWEDRVKKIVKRYRDERSVGTKDASRFNIFWSNVNILKPAAYDRPPNPNISRRFDEKDPVGKLAAEALERSVDYFVKEQIFDDVMKQVVLDRLLGGRASAWVRYVPHFRDAQIVGNEEVMGEGVQITDDVDIEEAPQEVYYEEVVVDYVHWQDYGHKIARTWEECDVTWRKAYLTRKELVERFGETGNAVPLDYTPKGKNDDKIPDDAKRATVYEIWDKGNEVVAWLHKDMPNLLDYREDPLSLKGFYCSPKPLFATLANDSLIPVPDYTQYQDQARELDNLTARIDALQKAIKVAGVYDASAPMLERILSEGVDNTLIAVDSWAAFASKGGLTGAIAFLPMQEIAATLLILYQTRDKVKQDLYEITGISDILRGQGVANETATAQQIKGQYAQLRLADLQKDVARFARDLVDLYAQIIANQFSIDTIKKISGMKLMTNMEKQQVQMAMQMGQQIPLEVQELMMQPSWDDVEALLRDEPSRCFKISIETDSTIKADQDAEKQARTEFTAAVASFLQQAVAAPPELLPLLGKILMFNIRAFKVAGELEDDFEQAIEGLQKKAANPPPPEGQKPDSSPQVAQIRAQSDMQIAQLDAQAKQAKAQIDAQAEVQKQVIKSQNEKEAAIESAKIKADSEVMREIVKPQPVGNFGA